MQGIPYETIFKLLIQFRALFLFYFSHKSTKMKKKANSHLAQVSFSCAFLLLISHAATFYYQRVITCRHWKPNPAKPSPHSSTYYYVVRLILSCARLILKMANKELKKMLHLCDLSAIIYYPEFKQYFVRKKAEGKNGITVINAIRTNYS